MADLERIEALLTDLESFDKWDWDAVPWRLIERVAKIAKEQHERRERAERAVEILEQAGREREEDLIGAELQAEHDRKRAEKAEQALGYFVGLAEGALEELGGPGPEYPLPVANAVEILRLALRGRR